LVPLPSWCRHPVGTESLLSLSLSLSLTARPHTGPAPNAADGLPGGGEGACGPRTRARREAAEFFPPRGNHDRDKMTVPPSHPNAAVFAAPRTRFATSPCRTRSGATRTSTRSRPSTTTSWRARGGVSSGPTPGSLRLGNTWAIIRNSSCPKTGCGLPTPGLTLPSSVWCVLSPPSSSLSPTCSAYSAYAYETAVLSSD